MCNAWDGSPAACQVQMGVGECGDLCTKPDDHKGFHYCQSKDNHPGGLTYGAQGEDY